MIVLSGGSSFVLRLERGEEIHETLKAFARDKGIEGAVVSGIGAVQSAELGFYHLDRQEYERRALPEITELLSLQGNLCLLEGKPFLHAHVVLMKSDFTLAGGHLFAATIAVTGEFHIQPTESMVRLPDPKVGLPLLNCPL
ncbi:MAG: DNA-binding protein [Candidatus Eisenbacteria bacterium]|uniref:DNA-binding protein n=1 Tax=Eiseniibacteriota bacterium TaxID=2212470 RepID=A0A7Y2H233_UNCEI|nr:DNA-binding protein [Candidatus Eisenbacteria bacterium]